VESGGGARLPIGLWGKMGSHKKEKTGRGSPRSKKRKELGHLRTPFEPPMGERAKGGAKRL